MLGYLLRTRGIAKVLHSGFGSHTSKGFSTKPIVSRSAEQGKHKTLQSMKPITMRNTIQPVLCLSIMYLQTPQAVPQSF